jgi:hypothetical protein
MPGTVGPIADDLLPNSDHVPRALMDAARHRCLDVGSVVLQPRRNDAGGQKGVRATARAGHSLGRVGGGLIWMR